ncbi:ankyrin repeat domain-containing T4SS effector AnkG [Coxiella burnetii]|uniref:ankyrin repeat domain-containing T4SS effector AnkG n=1 Tax=Coxiella burnetii TaxID=777 RepID=UPI000183CEA0|nr:ankyrin repeat domain-containing T4SS effector AnkG [Coxiella burnetii]ACJ18548.1 ankyrin repeat protein [Coxiella burnetii CbuG_Q212]ATN66930.1 hypothetical protein AYM17_05950 [Coxiella burnetii]OYK86253.1 ankyrin repeat domain-containing protein [Coxiella burnetii]
MSRRETPTSTLSSTPTGTRTPRRRLSRKGHPVRRSPLIAKNSIFTVFDLSFEILINAVEENSLDIIKNYLREDSFHQTAKWGLNVPPKTDFQGDTLLIKAAKKGKFLIAKALLEAGAYKEIVNKLGETALICAVRHFRVETLDLLIQYHADVKIKYKGQNLLELTLEKYSEKTKNFTLRIVQSLVAAGVELWHSDGSQIMASDKEIDEIIRNARNLQIIKKEKREAEERARTKKSKQITLQRIQRDLEYISKRLPFEENILTTPDFPQLFFEISKLVEIISDSQKENKEEFAEASISLIDALKNFGMILEKRDVPGEVKKEDTTLSRNNSLSCLSSPR